MKLKAFWNTYPASCPWAAVKPYLQLKRRKLSESRTVCIPSPYLCDWPHWPKHSQHVCTTIQMNVQQDEARTQGLKRVILAYWTTLWVSQPMQRRAIGWLVNYEMRIVCDWLCVLYQHLRGATEEKHAARVQIVGAWEDI